MALERIMTDALTHTFAGIGLSLLDFLTSTIMNPKKKRLEQKTRCVESIEALLDANMPPPADNEKPTDANQEAAAVQSVVPKNSLEYARHVTTVRDYLRASGIVKLQLPWFERLKDGLRNLLTHEKINILSTLPKLGVAAALEILYDVLIDFSANAFAGLLATLYQIPALFAGLWLGNGLKAVIAVFVVSSDERKLDKTLKQLLKRTEVVEIVVNYTPPEAVQRELENQGLNIAMTQLTRFGKGAYKHLQHLAESAKNTAEEVMEFGDRQEQHAAEEKEARRKRFDELTH